MALKSKLFKGDRLLEACLISDPAHIKPGSRGDHVVKIQLALNQLDDVELVFDGIYGSATAQAVMDYKNKAGRRILQPSQKTADNIVGK
jgi:peptidoglycan hydrolase-like protein with peptidoglycan-binding domain